MRRAQSALPSQQVRLDGKALARQPGQGVKFNHASQYESRLAVFRPNKTAIYE